MTAVEGINPAGHAAQMQSGVPDPAMTASGRQAAKPDDGGFSFGDFIDVINPLQHIPGVAELYRSITNDQISDGARKTGNMLYGFALGGPVGLGAMMAYTNIGDRIQADPAAGPDEPVQTAQAGAPLAETGSGEAVSPEAGGSAGDIPVPPAKPVHVEGAEGSDTSSGPALMGQTVAAAREMPGVPLNLTEMIAGTAASASDGADGANEQSAPRKVDASSVAYTQNDAEALEEKPFLPDAQSLGRIASHDANRLPLDVLKALQERHAQRTAPERS